MKCTLRNLLWLVTSTDRVERNRKPARGLYTIGKMKGGGLLARNLNQEEEVAGGDYPVAKYNESGSGSSKLFWSGRWDLNPRQLAWEARTLPLSYARPSIQGTRILRWRRH